MRNLYIWEDRKRSCKFLRDLCCIMTLKMHFLHPQLDSLHVTSSCNAARGEYGVHSYQDISAMKNTYKGKRSVAILANYCWKFSTGDRWKGPCSYHVSSLLCLASWEQYNKFLNTTNPVIEMLVWCSGLKIILSRHIFVFVNKYNQKFVVQCY
jgi:hypothetical protein